MVYVILPVHNGLSHTKKFIACLKQQTYKNIELILVDCGSTDGTEDWVTKNFHASHILTRKANTYWGDALRVAQKYMRFHGVKYTDRVLIANNDSVFDKHFIKFGNINSGFKELLTAESFANGKQFDGGIKVDWANLQFYVTQKNPNICSTRGLFMLASDFVDCAEISKHLPHYCSDYAFTHKLWKDGWRIRTHHKVQMEADLTNTGIIYPKNLRELFSIRCPDNPIYKTIFILQCCPKKYWFKNILRAWATIVRRKKQKEIEPCD